MKILGPENYNSLGRLGSSRPRPETPAQANGRDHSDSAKAAGDAQRPETGPAPAARPAALIAADESGRAKGPRKLTRENAQRLTAETSLMITELDPFDGCAAPHDRTADLRLVSPKYV